MREVTGILCWWKNYPHTHSQDSYLRWICLRFVIPLLFKRKRTTLYIGQLLMKNTIRYTDGAPVHFWLNEKYDNWWIGRVGSISWTPRSHDMTHLDFFLWGHIITNIYKTNLRDLDDLKNRISLKILVVKKETFHNVFLEVEKRLEFLYFSSRRCIWKIILKFFRMNKNLMYLPII
jgi:hypothetical protein